MAHRWRRWVGPVMTAWAAVACAHAPRFRDQPVVWHVADRRDIPEPEERTYYAKEYFAKVLLAERIDRSLALPDREAAWNTNALDEVPNSSWFQNRIGVRRVFPDEAARGLERGGPPKLPLAIVGGKVGGGNPGFIAKDASGRTFLVKFDTRENPELQTAAGVIVNRIFWTLGYNVPSDHVFSFERGDLTIAPGATYRDALRQEQTIGSAMVESILRTAPRSSDGSYRAFASQFLEGVPKGGFSPHGVRPDDPNDRIPHEHRRELRGLRVFAAWLAHTDMKEDNTLDMYVEEDGKRFLRHYLLDFGEALDAHAAEKGRDEDGWEYVVDWEKQFLSTCSLGLWHRPWEGRPKTRWASLGSFTPAPFDPEAFRVAYPFAPFLEMDAADAYWAAKLVMKFDRPLLRAIVAEGKLTEPGAAQSLVNTLLRRRDVIAKTYLDAVTPFDEFEITPKALCMTDVALRHGLVTGGMFELLAGQGEEIRASRRIAPSGRFCLAVPADGDYRILRLRVRRGAETRPPMEIHLKGGPRARILGVIRVVE